MVKPLVCGKLVKLRFIKLFRIVSQLIISKGGRFGSVSFSAPLIEVLRAVPDIGVGSNAHLVYLYACPHGRRSLLVAIGDDSMLQRPCSHVCVLKGAGRASTFRQPRHGLDDGLRYGCFDGCSLLLFKSRQGSSPQRTALSVILKRLWLRAVMCREQKPQADLHSLRWCPASKLCTHTFLGLREGRKQGRLIPSGLQSTSTFFPIDFTSCHSSQRQFCTNQTFWTVLCPALNLAGAAPTLSSACW